MELAVADSGSDAFAGLDGVRGLHEPAVGESGDAVAAGEGGLGAEQFQFAGQGGGALPDFVAVATEGGFQPVRIRFDALPVGADEERAGRQPEPVGEVVDALLVLPDHFGGVPEDAIGESPARFAQPVTEVFVEALLELPEFGLEFVLGADDQLGGGAGGRGAEVGNEVGNGEINFVADGGDCRDAGPGEGAGDDFFVEGPEVFEGAAPAGDDDDVDEVEGVELVDGGGNLGGGTVALDANGVDDDVAEMPAGDDVEEIPDRGAGG